MKTMVIVQKSYPGLLAEITSLLADNGIVLKDFSGQTLGSTAVISILAKPYRDALRLLSESGYHVFASETLLIRLKREAGALASISQKLANAGVDVRGLHIVNKGGGAAIVALETADHERARNVLADLLV